jgi:hypothetical protein
MPKPRLEKRRHGWALVSDARVEPFGYVRDDKLRMKAGDDYIDLSPEDLERLAQELRVIKGKQSARFRPLQLSNNLG